MKHPAASLPLGIVIQRRPGVTRWAKWSWKAVAVLPGAAPGDWAVLRQEGDVVEYHAATLPLELWRGEAKAYLDGLEAQNPAIYVVMRKPEQGDAEHPFEVILATASPYEAQDFMNITEEIVEPVPMPPGVYAWVREFVDTHYEEEAFVKRRRDKTRVDRVDDGRGDPRVRQTADVYRAPRRKDRLQ